MSTFLIYGVIIIILSAALFSINLKKKKPVPENIPNSNKYRGCYIEYMPKTGRYYPRVQHCYLWRKYASDILETSTSIAYCEYGKTKKEAVELLNEYLETHGKGSIILEVQDVKD